MTLNENKHYFRLRKGFLASKPATDSIPSPLSQIQSKSQGRWRVSLPAIASLFAQARVGVKIHYYSTLQRRANR